MPWNCRTARALGERAAWEVWLWLSATMNLGGRELRSDEASDSDKPGLIARSR
jgi:hypothetical protein